MANLFDVKGGKFYKVFGALAEHMDPAIADAICDEFRGPNIIRAMIAGAWDYLNTNPYEMTVEQQHAALRRANDEEKWGITEEDFTRLAATAPAWPKGKHAYRSLRIRFGEGSEGVQLTFERHISRIKSVFGESNLDRSSLRSGKSEYEGKPADHLRLLNGNNTHKAVIEWVIFDLDTHRRRESVRAVCDTMSLADELLVAAWMFPDRIRAIDYDDLPGLVAAGYEYSVLLYTYPWESVCVGFHHGSRTVCMHTVRRGDNGSDHSVPRLRALSSPIAA